MDGTASSSGPTQTTELTGTETSPVQLPPPKFSPSASVLEALRNRRSIRSFSDKALDMQELSDLLWAADGVNRPAGWITSEGYTASTGLNAHDVDIYLITQKGAYLYNSEKHLLFPVASGDLRSLACNGQEGLKDAPVTLLYVADVTRLPAWAKWVIPHGTDPKFRAECAHIESGLIAGNVYLHAASRGLAACIHLNVDKAIAEKLKLDASKQVLILGHSVGRAKTPADLTSATA